MVSIQVNHNHNLNYWPLQVCVRATLTPLSFDTRVTYGSLEVLRGTNDQPRYRIDSINGSYRY